jgi:hypothetical protein
VDLEDQVQEPLEQAEVTGKAWQVEQVHQLLVGLEEQMVLKLAQVPQER